MSTGGWVVGGLSVWMGCFGSLPASAEPLQPQPGEGRPPDGGVGSLTQTREPTPGGSRAEGPESCREVSLERRWYGWQTLATDGAAFALFAYAGTQQFSGALPNVASTTGVAMLLLGAPTVHWAHGRIGTGFLSLGMRLVAPTLGAVVGSLDCGADCGGPLLLGLVIATSPLWIDPGLLAFEDVPAAKSPALKLELRPHLSLSRRWKGIAVSGTF